MTPNCQRHADQAGHGWNAVYEAAATQLQTMGGTTGKTADRLPGFSSEVES